MNNWIPKKTLIVSSLAATVTCIMIYTTGLFLVFGEIDKIEGYYTDTESKSGREERVRAIKFAADAYKQEIESLRKFFIQKGDEVKFIEQIEEAGRRSELAFEISDLSVKDASSKSEKEDVVVRVDIEGSWESVVSFLEELQKMEFGVLIEEVNLDAKNPGFWSGFIEFVVFRNK